MPVDNEIMKYTLWFDVEQRYKTIHPIKKDGTPRLWFDVEQRYKTMMLPVLEATMVLWFDVEQRYKTIGRVAASCRAGCGLM